MLMRLLGFGFLRQQADVALCYQSNLVSKHSYDVFREFS
jgi:hypothetical protein